MNGFSFTKNKKLIVLVLSAVAMFTAAVFVFAFFTDRANRTTTLQTASFDAEGYAIDVSAPVGYLTAGDTVDVVLEESNEKSKDISSQVTMTAIWESPVSDTHPWDDISISVDGEAISHSVDTDQTISFTLPKKALPSGSAGKQSNLTIQLPTDLVATGTIKFSFEQIKLHSGEWTHDYAKEKLSALNFEIGAAWNISKDQTTTLGNSNRDVIAFLTSGTSTEDYSLEVVKTGSDTNTNYGQMMNWTAKEQTPWAKYDITDLSLSEGVTTIGCYAFAGETGITSLSLPSTVNTIGIGAFQGSGLAGDLVFPATVMSIESLAFGALPNVDAITFEHGPDDSLILPDNTSEGEETSGAFYVSDYVGTTLNFNGNTVAENYDWVADHRMKVGISEVILSYEDVDVGKTVTPSLTISPTNYDDYQSIKYELTSGNDCAEIDPKTGALTGIANGSVTVQVTIIDANGNTVQATTDISVLRTPIAMENADIGSTVTLNISGTPTEFIVVHQGNPDSSLYDASVDGTWLLMKDIYESRQWGATANDYANYGPHTYLNGTFLGLFDVDIQPFIKTVKIPYVKGDGSSGSVASGSNGLSTKIFLLGGYEVGFTTNDNSTFPIDGAKLDYFENGTSTSANSKRIAYYNSETSNWWLRSARMDGTYYTRYVTDAGGTAGLSIYGETGFRPALILPSDVIIDSDGAISVDHLIMDSASVTKQPNKTTYTEGETFDPTGMEVTITYKDGSTKTISADELTVTDGSELTADQTEVTLSYSQNDQTVEVTVSITVEKLPIAMENAEIGDVVYLNENGKPVEYIIVNQGVPGSSKLYDSSCDGTWLLRRDIHSERAWHSATLNNYSVSTIRTYLGGDFFALYDEDVQTVIKQVKLPYVNGAGGAEVASGSNGISARVFLLSAYEVGFTQENTNYGVPIDGACLSYFSTAAYDENRLAYYNDTVTEWWLRSPYVGNTGAALSVSSNGGWDVGNASLYSFGVRPALILPSDAIINADGTVDVSNVYLDDIESLPSQSNSLTYTGEEQTVSWNDYDSSQLTLSGTTSATNAGTYTAIFTPKNHYRWSDGTTDAKEVEWTIEKAEGSLSLSSSTIELDEGSTATIEVTRAGDGAISATSSDNAVATVNVDGTTITVTGATSGTATITVAVAEGTNHKATNKTCATTVKASGYQVTLKAGWGAAWNSAANPWKYGVGHDTYAGEMYIHYSTDGGATWVDVPPDTSIAPENTLTTLTGVRTIMFKCYVGGGRASYATVGTTSSGNEIVPLTVGTEVISEEITLTSDTTFYLALAYSTVY